MREELKAELHTVASSYHRCAGNTNLILDGAKSVDGCVVVVSSYQEGLRVKYQATENRELKTMTIGELEYHLGRRAPIVYDSFVVTRLCKRALDRIIELENAVRGSQAVLHEAIASGGPE